MLVSGRLVSHFLAFVLNFCPKQFTVRGSQFFLKMCRCWCPPIFLIIHFSPRSVTAGVRPFSAGHAAFPFMCLRGLSLLVSVVFRRRCNISIHLFSSSVTAGVRPFPLAMQHVYSFVSRVCHWCCRPFPLAMKHFYSFVSHVISFFLSFRFGPCTAVFCPVGWNRFTCCVTVSGIAFLPHCATLSFVFLFGPALAE